MFLLFCLWASVYSAPEIKIVNSDKNKLKPGIAGQNVPTLIRWKITDGVSVSDIRLLLSQRKNFFGRKIEIKGRGIKRESDGTYYAYVFFPKKGIWYIKVQAVIKSRKYYSNVCSVKISDPPILKISKMKGMYSPYPKSEPQAARWLLFRYKDGEIVERDFKAASAQKRFPVFSIYALLGAPNVESYKVWLKTQAEAIGRFNYPCVVVLEPDRFASKASNDSILDWSVMTMKECAPNAAVFLDIGNSNWLPPSTVAKRVKKYKSYDLIDGFSSNVSNFRPDKDEEKYAKALYKLTKKPSIIDTSRNGLATRTGKCPKSVHNPPRSEWEPGAEFKLHPRQPFVLFNYHNKPYHERD